MKMGGFFVQEKKVIGNVSVHDNSNGNSNVGNNHYGKAITSQDANQPYETAKLQLSIQPYC